MFSDAGDAGKPGIVIISPVKTTTKPAPFDKVILFTVIAKSLGAPKSEGLSDKEYCVLATHIGRLLAPNFKISSNAFLAL